MTRPANSTKPNGHLIMLGTGQNATGFFISNSGTNLVVARNKVNGDRIEWVQMSASEPWSWATGHSIRYWLTCRAA